MRVLNRRRAVSGTELPYRVVSVADPVGAVVTDTGLAFGITPLRPFTRPVRLTCTQCSWQVAVVGLPAIGERARGHASTHDPVVEPQAAGRFGWLAWPGWGRSGVSPHDGRSGPDPRPET